MDRGRFVRKSAASNKAMSFQTMCSCGGVNNRSRLFCIFLAFNLLLVLIIVPEEIMGKVMSSEKDDMSSSSAQVADSSEDEAPGSDSFGIMDDEAVRFVTDEDFVYEDEIIHHHDDLYQQNVKGGNTRIALHQEKCPPLPEPAAVVNSGLCTAKLCQIDEDCSRDGSVVCCYNGCIHSCLPKVNPPVAFDWVEETELKQFSLETNVNEEQSISPRTLLGAELRPAAFSLPGGCHIDSEQYQDLIMFRKLNHVTTCTCTQGEVLCEVSHEDLDLDS
ncbi:unnamed protein product [Orchesella dallaii]|uniref:WAP domain-containing protein n=1 Tax=Orchesella dallaii TaxID=48710 RepID=A0ABP1QA47_9HEXA